jgi:sarcosine oxidase, subunit gamma
MLETRHAARRGPALDGPGPAPAGDASAVTLRLLPPDARFSLRVDPSAAASLGVVAGFPLGMGINRHAVSGGRRAARVGPDEWLLLAPEADADLIGSEIAKALGTTFHALVDIGHRHVAFAISGRRAADALNAGCPLDLAAASFPTGSATRTLLGKAEIVLLRLDDAPTFRVECWRSFAPYVHAFLSEAALAV